MTTVWKGAINFGLINVPVKLKVATKRENPAFRSLHKECLTPINQKRFCASCNKEVAYEDLVKGYEYEKGKFVVINEQDLDALPIKSAKYIQLVDFIMLSEVDPIYFEKTYFLVPEASSEKPYYILYNAMKRTGKAAVGKVTIREREHLCLVRVYEDCLALNTMFFSDEVRAQNEVDIQKIEKRAQVSKLEEDLAEQIIQNLTAAFDIEKYHDEYREQLMKLIEAKIEGEDIVQPKLKVDDRRFADLLERLKASVEATKNDAKEPQKKSKPVAKAQKKSG